MRAGYVNQDEVRRYVPRAVREREAAAAAAAEQRTSSRQPSSSSSSSSSSRAPGGEAGRGRLPSTTRGDGDGAGAGRDAARVGVEPWKKAPAEDPWGDDEREEEEREGKRGADVKVPGSNVGGSEGAGGRAPLTRTATDVPASKLRASAAKYVPPALRGKDVNDAAGKRAAGASYGSAASLKPGAGGGGEAGEKKKEVWAEAKKEPGGGRIAVRSKAAAKGVADVEDLTARFGKVSTASPAEGEETSNTRK